MREETKREEIIMSTESGNWIPQTAPDVAQSVTLAFVTLLVFCELGARVLKWLKKRRNERFPAADSQIGVDGDGLPKKGRLNELEKMVASNKKKLEEITSRLEAHIKLYKSGKAVKAGPKVTEQPCHEFCKGDGMCKIRMDNLESQLNSILGKNSRGSSGPGKEECSQGEPTYSSQTSRNTY